MKINHARPISRGFRAFKALVRAFKALAGSLKPTRRKVAVVWVLSSGVLLGWALLRSYKEESGTLYPSLYPPSFHVEEFFQSRLTVSSVDEINRTAQAKVQVISKWPTGAADQFLRVLRFHGVPPLVIDRRIIRAKDGVAGVLMWAVPLSAFMAPQSRGNDGEAVFQPLPPPAATRVQPVPSGPDASKEPSPNLDGFADLIGKATLYFGPLAVEDLAVPFDFYGVAAFADLAPPPPPPPVPPGPFKTDPPEQSTELRMLGNPLLYPFDRYILTGRIASNVLATLDGKRFTPLDVLQTDVEVQSPGFIQRDLSFDDLRRLHKELPKQVGMLLIEKGERKNSDVVFNYLDRAKRNQEQVFAVELRRPFFLRFIAVFLLFVSLASISYYLAKSTVKEFGLQAVGFFVGLWAVRQILMSNGPKLFTVVDYAIFILYFGLIVGLLAKAIYPAKVSEPSK